MVLWMITEDGRRLRLVDSFFPRFYLNGPKHEIRRVLSIFHRNNSPIVTQSVNRLDFFSRLSIPVIQVTVQDPTRFSDVVKKITRLSEDLSFYNCDISLPQQYFFERGLFPLAFCSMTHTRAGAIRSIKLLDSLWSIDYSLPPLRMLSLKLEGDFINPNHGWRGKLEIQDDQECHVLEEDEPQALLHLFNDHLRKQDPDLILTDWGDSFILPQLQTMSRKTRVPLALNRDPTLAIAGRRQRSYASYGRMVYNAGSQTLFGRWHIDRQNSFILHEAGLEGLFEQSRVTQLPIQTIARTSTGTGITSMQLSVAYRMGILIPWRKQEPEVFKSALDLLTIDKGGLVFLPPVGFHENVAELDFTSMYPSIMSRYNISPETVGCACCPQNRAPEIGYSICTRRRGLVPKTLEPLLAKRARYKEQLSKTIDAAQRICYDQRQTALKWLLVVSFGYLGYKNARFGRIEAHECVTAYSREKLLQTKEIAESKGFQLIHAIVDSVWLKKIGATRKDYEDLAAAISNQVGLEIKLEGIYRWIGFPPSKSRPTLSVPNRFFGLLHSGKMKIRGIEMRRSDTPPFIKTAQTNMIEILRQARHLKDYVKLIPDVIALLMDYRQQLADRNIPLKELIITRNLSRDPRDYEKATLSAVVAHELLARGIRLHPGESIQYIITHATDQDPASRARAYNPMTPDYSYDVEKYTELLLKAGETLLSCFGYDFKKLAALTNLHPPHINSFLHLAILCFLLQS